MRFDLVASHNSPDDVDGRFGEDATVDVLRRVAKTTPWPHALDGLVVRLLLETSSNAVRDAAAIALIDLDARDSVDALLLAIERPTLRQHNGTLVYALHELGGALPLALLVQLVEQGSFEASAEAVLMIEEGRCSIPADQIAASQLRARLVGLAEDANSAVADAAQAALAALA